MRIRVTAGMLAMFVEEELQVRTMGEEHFTAYDITRALRRRHVQVNIPHAPVRAIVHNCMGSLLAAGHYQASICYFGPQAAVMYQPAPVAAPPNPPGIPGLPFLPLPPLN